MKRLAFLICLSTPVYAGTLPDADAVFPAQDPVLVQLGWHLFYDPILGGNSEVACATCHHPKHGTSDGLSLGIGDGGIGLGPARIVDPENPPEQRIPRNSPALFNLGATEFTSLFHDGRLEADADQPDGIRTPLGQEMVHGFSGVLSAQSMFPVLSPDEMAGHYSENKIAQAVRQGFLTGPDGAWEQIAARVSAIPEYKNGFATLLGEKPLSFTDISDALAAFMAQEWRADNAPFDIYLRDGVALAPDAAVGMELFYGSAGCASCHSGQFQTDHAFHAIAMPQLGPGKAARFERHARDEGRMHVTGQLKDAYAFRTPSLRNVEKTAPYGHSGAYATLEAVVRHHLDPITALQNYDRSQVQLPDLTSANDWRILDDPKEVSAIIAANDLSPVALTNAEIDAIIAFLGTLTDEKSLHGHLGIPKTVPSGFDVPN